MKTWKERRTIGRTTNNEPTMTDQAGAANTDLNIIVSQFLKTGKTNGSAIQPRYGDFADLPTDLRGYLDLARQLPQLRAQLPAEYQNMSNEELLSRTPAELLQITKDANTIKERRNNLPDQFKRMSDQDILRLTQQQYEHILTPPAIPPAPGVSNEPVRNPRPDG